MTSTEKPPFVLWTERTRRIYCRHCRVYKDSIRNVQRSTSLVRGYCH